MEIYCKESENRKGITTPLPEEILDDYNLMGCDNPFYTEDYWYDFATPFNTGLRGEYFFDTAEAEVQERGFTQVSVDPNRSGMISDYEDGQAVVVNLLEQDSYGYFGNLLQKIQGGDNTAVLIFEDFRHYETFIESYDLDGNKFPYFEYQPDLNSIWTQDYMQKFGYRNGELFSVESAYPWDDYNNPLGESEYVFLHELFADSHVNKQKNPLNIPYGNLHFNYNSITAQHLCVTTDDTFDEYNHFMEKEQVEDMIRDFFLCDELVVVRGDFGIGHVDEILTIVDGTIILATISDKSIAELDLLTEEYDPNFLNVQTTKNVLDEIGAELREDLPEYEIIEIPLQLIQVEGKLQFGKSANAIVLNDDIYVPVYGTVGDQVPSLIEIEDETTMFSLEQQNQALLGAYREAMPEYNVIPVEATYPFFRLGGLHCTVSHIPLEMFEEIRNENNSESLAQNGVGRSR